MIGFTPAGKQVTLTLLKDRLAVRQMVRPEMHGRLYLPDKAYRQDTSETLWDVLDLTEEANRALHWAVEVGDILVTRKRWPVDTGLTDMGGFAIFIMGAATAGIRNVIKNTWDEPWTF